ncbi:MAG TPA: DUF3793 family protein [Collinsella ihuae]|uniref:DUF3793 family protein n=1 Tax=Collinsella ihumii TaxID=1720204 RepID=A0A921LQP7_9ACTN|nr:DUF3793 family protein [Collinsella ihumii]
MTRTIDSLSLERAIVRHCSPTLAALKPASLFTFPGNFVDAPDSQTHRHALAKAITACEQQLASAGITVRVLAWRTCGALVYVYRPAELAAYLSDRRASRLLGALGYDTASLDRCIGVLAGKLQAMDPGSRKATRETSCPCTSSGCSKDFPHEMGLFLGYPYEDVVGFIQHRGRDYLAVGMWKVYADLERALATFERFKRCAAASMRAHQNGSSLAQLAIATR